MRTISAALVVLAGAIVFAASGFIAHNDTQMSYGLIGFGLIGLGAFRWWLLSIENE